MKETFPIIIYLALALIISIAPFVRRYFSIWNLLILEGVQFCIAGRNKRRQLEQEHTKLEGIRVKEAFVLYIGHTLSLFAAIGLFYLVSTNNYIFIFYFLIALSGIALLLWVRHLIRIIWIITAMLLLAGLVYLHDETTIMHGGIFLAFLILMQAIFASFKVLRSSIANRKVYAATGFFARFKWIQRMVFGLVLSCQSLYAGFFIVNAFLR